MKKMFMMSVMALLAASQAWSGDDFDSIRGDTTRATNRPRTSTVDVVEGEVARGIKQKCNYSTGCVLIVDEGNGNEFRVSAGAGVGPSFNNGVGNGGIVINNGSTNEEYYGIQITFVHSNFTCIRRVNEASFKLIETYERLMASREYVDMIFKAFKRGEDLPTPSGINTALSVLSTLKPTQGNCGQSHNYNR